MKDLPKCPVCGEDSLRVDNIILENGNWHYRVECQSCGVEFHHADFYGYNMVMEFFENAGRGECNDCGEDDEFMCSHCGYAHEYTPEELKDPKAFSFCPTCGAEVQR